MSAVDRVSGTSAKVKSDDIPKRLLAPIARMLHTNDDAATVNRLFVSKPVKDLRLIIAFSLAGVAIAGAVGLGVSLADGFRHHKLFSNLGSFGTFFAPVLGIFGAVLAWAYQAGSVRLGIVDLFACEIDTLCRVALVVDSVPRSIEAFEQTLQGRNGASNAVATTRHFTSEESYFPVFENNTGDLQSLEARVVINITAFYTYMKAVRDSTRALMDMSAASGQPDSRAHKTATLSPSQEAARNVIYMMFLGLESGRKAMKCLVQFEPELAERTIVILISELEAYGFLRDQFVDQKDIRYQRLQLRKADYEELVPSLCGSVETSRASKRSDWEPAWRLVPELKRRYAAAMSPPHETCRVLSTARSQDRGSGSTCDCQPFA